MAKAKKGKMTTDDMLKKGFEKSGYDQDKGVKEEGPADKKRDKKQFAAYKKAKKGY